MTNKTKIKKLEKHINNILKDEKYKIFRECWDTNEKITFEKNDKYFDGSYIMKISNFILEIFEVQGELQPSAEIIRSNAKDFKNMQEFILEITNFLISMK